jgi:hypothetical protein
MGWRKTPVKGFTVPETGRRVLPVKTPVLRLYLRVLALAGS